MTSEIFEQILEFRLLLPGKPFRNREYFLYKIQV